MDIIRKSTGIADLVAIARRADLRVPLLVLLISLAITVAVSRNQAHQSASLAQLRFDQLGAAATEKIEASMLAYAQVLRGGAGLFDATPDVTGQAWARYVRALALPSNYPGIQGVAYATVLRTEAEVATLEARLRAEGRAELTIGREAAHPLKAIVTHIGQLDPRNERAIGFDMYSEPTRTAAMDRAIVTGKPTLSAKLTIAQETVVAGSGEMQAGVLLFLPVYRQGAPLDTAEARRVALTGFIVSPFRMNDLIRGILRRGTQNEEQLARFEIYDAPALEPSTLLYRSSSNPATAASLYKYTTTRTLNDRPWTISATSTPMFESQRRSRIPELIFAAGLLLSCLISWLIASLAQHRRELSDASRRTELALDAGSTGIWTLDRKSGYFELDERSRAIWGVPGAGATTEAAIEALIVPEDREARQRARDHAIDSGGHYDLEYRIAAHDGAPQRWVVVRGQVSSEDNTISGTIRDITARKSAEAQLAASEAQLAGLIESASDAIVSIDATQRLIRFNAGAERIFGYTAAEVLGQPIDFLIPVKAHASHKRHIDTFGRDTTRSRRMGERGEIFGRRKDGREFPAEASITRLDLPSGQVFIAILRDITDRKLFEQRLETTVTERTAELAALLDALPDGIVQADVGRVIRRPNASMTRLFGYSREELIGMRASKLYAHSSDNAAIENAWVDWEAGADSGEGSAYSNPVSVQCRRKDGSTFAALVRGNVVRDEKRRIVSRVGVIRDVTGEVARARALQQTQKMESVGQLAGGIAHDFNNLLTVITGNQELLEMRLKEEKDLALLKRAQNAADMGARLTGRLLTFARQRERSQSVLDINAVISGMSELLNRSIGEQVILKQVLAADLGSVKADQSEIENAILNLVINARDAMPEGGAILVETANCVVEPADREYGRLAPGAYVRLSVSDTGAGMSPEVVARAFEPFFTTKLQGKGTGLGLAMIYGLAQQAGGNATIYSEIGRGTTINVHLPQVDANGQKPAPALTSLDLPLGAGETVLLVEDDEQVRQVARERLTSLGYTVLEADSGSTALERLKNSTGAIDLVFSDVVMPGKMSGYDVAEWVSTHKPGIKLLLTSGYPDEMARAHGKPTVNLKLLRKPYSRIELARALQQALKT